jgi:hypothetical protein
MKELSKILSEAILQALEDLEIIKNDSRYTINFSTWHSPLYANGQFGKEPQGICTVCFAGSVMANRLNGNIKRILDPTNFKEEQMLYALNFIRAGYINDALKEIEYKGAKTFDDIMVRQKKYEHFVEDMNYIAGLLKENGL